MKRRRFVAGLSAVVAGSASVVGSGAFTSVAAKRDAEVDLKNDTDAYLGLFELGAGGRSEKVSGQLTFSFPGDSEPGHLGLGTDSIYVFKTDASADDPGLFEVVNQGANTVEVYATQTTTSGVPAISIFAINDPTTILDGDPSSVTLSPGQSFEGGFEIDTHDVPLQNTPYEVTLQLHAEL